MESSTIQGAHMTHDTFLRALECTKHVEWLAWKMGCPPIVLLSGGECTEHPDIELFMSTALKQGFQLILITNGMWLSNKELRESLLRPEWKVMVQVTYDPRFYPEPAPARVEDNRITYVPALSILMPMGRAAGKVRLEQLGVPPRYGPSSFNLRSMTRSFGTIEQAVAMMRARATTGLSGHCSPSISDNGDFMAGETRDCFKLGTVDSTTIELTEALLTMSCNKCGLEDNLSPEQKRAIGATALFGPNE